MSFVAPRAWPEGAGRLHVVWRGEPSADVPVTVGSSAPVSVSAGSPERTVELALPEGVSIRRTLRARVLVQDPRSPSRPALGDLQVSLRLPDGRTEVVPVVGLEEATGAFRAERRPPRGVAVALGLLGLLVVLWLTEALPLFATALLVPVVLVVSGTAEAGEALAPFFDPIIAIFFGGFLMAEAMKRVGLDRRVAVTIVALAGRGPVRLLAAMVGAAAFLSLWMSNTAATALLLPIALVVTEPLGHVGYRKAMVLGIAYASTAGGVGSAIGTPANPLAIEFLGAFAGRSIGFVEWFAFGLPMVVLFLPIMGAYLWWRAGARIDPTAFAASRLAAIEQRRALGRLTRGETTVLSVFVAVLALWCTQTWHGVHTGIVALGGVAALAALGRLEAGDLGRISWSSLLTFGGGLALGVHLVETGTADWLASRLAGLGGLPSWFGLAVVAFATLALTAVASNTAAAAMVIPLAVPLAAVLGVDPVHLVVVVAVASSIDFALVVGTPPTMIAHSTGLFRASEIFRIGAVLDVVALTLLLTAVAGIWRLLGLVA
jgi:sodium-dependent dicarboxylate transporter 2/3/5